MSLEFATKENQDARASLRENFLKRVLSLQGKKCQILMHENTNVEGEFKGTDLEFQEILIDDLKTPASTIPHSVIRGGDVISMVFTEDNKPSL